MDASYSFGAWLKRRRKGLDLTQAELARRLDCATVTLQKIELDERRPSKQMAERLAEILNILPAERPSFVRSARGDLAFDRLDVAPLSGQTQRGARAAVSHPLHNLPAQLTSFIGREHEVRLMLAMLQQEDVRLLTLNGPGGTGKTRVSLQLANELLDAFPQSVPDGVWFVDLASITDPAVVPPAIATVLGVREVAGHPLLESLQTYLASKRMLLMLDNFEQVLAAAPLVADLLGRACHLKILVTSRSVLGVYGEQIVAVPTLDLPDPTDILTPDQAAQTGAVALFLARVRAATPDFALTPTNIPTVVELCRQLDGLPLAIELAAARCRLLPPQALLQRLIQQAQGRLQLLIGGPRTLPARQQTLRNTIDWSHDLLTASEQVLFRRLAAFAGGWTIEAAEAICTLDDIRLGDVLEGVSSLGDKSLVRPGAMPDGEPRFSMLETIREYALERLVASGEVAMLRERHAHYYLHWLESMQAQYRSGVDHSVRFWYGDLQHDEGAGRVRADVSNLTATMEWITQHGDLQFAMRWWDVTAQFDSVAHLAWNSSAAWERWCNELLGSRDRIPVRTQVKAFIRIGQFAYWAGDLPRAATLLKEGLVLSRSLDNPSLIVRALEWLGHAYREQDMYARAASLYKELMARARASGEPFDIASAHHCLGELALLQEEYPRALEQAQASLPAFRALGVEWGITCGSIHQGFAALHLGNDELAAQSFPEALRVARLYDGGSHIRGALAGYVAMALRRGMRDIHRAGRLFGAIAMGSMVYAHRRACERLVAAARVQCDEIVWEVAYAEGRRMTLEQAIAYALGTDEPA